MEIYTPEWESGMLCMMEVMIGILFLFTLAILVMVWMQIQSRKVLKRTKLLLQRTETDLREFRAFVEHEVMILRTDLDGNLTHASAAFSEFMGFEERDLLGKPFRQILQPEALPEYYHDLWSTLAVTFGWRDEISGQKQSGKQFWAEINVVPVRDSAGTLDGYHAVIHDISSKKQLEVLSVTDEMTGLFNRRHFNQCFIRELIRSRRSKDPAIFAMMDVDHFKRYNDFYGHQKGDEVLKAIGALILKLLRRPTDYAFRLGGEEFGILLIQMPQDKAHEFLDKIRQEVADLAIPHEQNGTEKVVTISMGSIYAEIPDPDLEATYFREADANLYLAKDQGRNRLVSSVSKANDSKSS